MFLNYLKEKTTFALIMFSFVSVGMEMEEEKQILIENKHQKYNTFEEKNTHEDVQTELPISPIVIDFTEGPVMMDMMTALLLLLWIILGMKMGVI